MLKKIAKTYLRIVETICVVLLFMIFSLMVIQVVCRLFTIGQNFTEELARICFCIMVFFGAPLAMAEGADISVDMLYKVLPKPAQKVLGIIVNVGVIGFAAFCIRSLITFTSVNKGVTAFSMTWIQMNWIYYAMLVGFAFLAIVGAVKLIQVVKGQPETIDINAEEKAEVQKKEGELDLGI